MLTALLLILFFGLGYVILFRFRIPWRNLPKEIHNSFYHLNRASSWILLVFFLVILLFPLICGLEFFLKTDANVVVVIFFFFWCYQWIKIVWNSMEKIP